MKKKPIAIVLMIIGGLVTLLVVVGLVIFAFVSCTALVSLNDSELFLKKTDLSGDIIVLSDKLTVGEPIPLVLEVPEDIDELHKEMWSVEPLEGDSETRTTIVLYEGDMLGEVYEQSELKTLFEGYDIEAYLYDGQNTRMAVFVPESKGKYVIDVYGYYKTTSPRYVTEIEVNVK